MAKKKKTSMRDKIKSRAKKREGSNGAPYLKIGKDDMYVLSKNQSLNFLPYKVTADNHPEVDEGEYWYQRSVFVHRNIGADNKTVICPAKTTGDKCPICEHRGKLMKSPDVDEDLLNDLRPKERELFNVINRKKKSDGIKVFDVSVHLFGKMLDEEIREGEDDYADFADIDDGKYLQIRAKKKSFAGNTFFETTRIDFKDREDLKKKDLKNCFDLDDILIILSYEELEDLYWETAEDDDDDEPRGKKKGKKSAKKSKQYEEDDDDEEDDEDDEDDEEDDDDEDDKCDECPAGFVFGKDCNSDDECDECECWEECQDLQDTLKAKKKKKKKRR